jgi:Spy/CpxP family protein refolding chaperone
MTRRISHACALALCAVACCASLALAAAPPAQEGAEPAPAITMNPITAVNAMNKSIRENDKQNQAAVDAMKQAQAGQQVMPAIGNGGAQGAPSAPAAPAQKPGGGKVIYGDIIIHK